LYVHRQNGLQRRDGPCLPVRSAASEDSREHPYLGHALICCRGSHRRPVPTWNTNHHCRVVGRCVRPSRYLRAPSRETGKQQRASGWKRRSGVGAYLLARHEQEGWGQTLGCPPHSTGQSAGCRLLRGAGAGGEATGPGADAALPLLCISVGAVWGSGRANMPVGAIAQARDTCPKFQGGLYENIKLVRLVVPVPYHSR
jgi:hypothetical protein